LVVIPPGEGSRQDDGSPYEPIEMRVVVSRYLREGEAEHGVVLDGWQYELFVVDVPPEALPAAEAVAQFFARAGQENRFAQEDREVGLDRIFSYHLPGQEFAVLVGLWVWNLRIVRGFELHTPPDIQPNQTPGRTQLDDRTAPADSTPPPAPDVEEKPAPEPPAPEEKPVPEPSRGSSPEGDSGSENTAQEAQGSEDVRALLREVDWEQALQNRAGWSWDEASGQLRCPTGEPLVLTTIHKTGRCRSGRTGIIFCRTREGCAPCGRRSTCLPSEAPNPNKHAEISIPTPLAERLRVALILTRRGDRGGRRVRPFQRISPPVRKTLQLRPLSTAGPVPEAKWAVLTPLFLPATARRLWRTETSSLTVAVVVVIPPPLAKPILIAASVAERQHRRKTWRENFERHALGTNAVVEIALNCSEVLRQFFERNAGGKREAV
jgi:hypothetical protein